MTKARELGNFLSPNDTGFSITSGNTTEKTLTILNDLTITSNSNEVFNLSNITVTPDFILMSQGII